ncbi:MAG TPA: hypothetical protein VFM29_04675 [Vicinamibacteria bacterium]|nr:hypothetical protein [Vicinamibacteria bacterium]
MGSVCEEPEVRDSAEAARARQAVQAVRGYLTAGTYAGRRLEKAEAALLHAQSAVEGLRARAEALRQLSSDALARSGAALDAAAAAAAADAPADASAAGEDQRTVIHAGEVTIECSVGVDPEERETLVEEMKSALQACPGPWRVDLSEVEGQDWWALRLHGSGFRWVTTFQTRAEQKPREVAARVRTAMQIALLERQLGRPRRRHE